MGTLTTAKYQERVSVFDKMNQKALKNAALLPQQSYFGPIPDPQKDPYDRRKVKQLNDISFEGDSGEEEGAEIYENVRTVQRLPQTILTEENLRVYLTKETEKLDLEHSYWLKDTFLDKVGRMAPNLRWLSLRRIKISNRAFNEIATHLKQLERIDISDCTLIQPPSFKLMLSNNKSTLQQIQASNTPSAVTDEVMDLLAWTPNLTFLDISHAK